MGGTSSTFSIQDLPVLIAAVGALGMAAFGAVEAIGKTLFVFDTPWFGGGRRSWGLPYVGFAIVRRLVKPLAPAMKVAYGAGYDAMLRQQYRDSRASGQAPDTIRQGVRLGLPFLSVDEAADVIGAAWGLDKARSRELAQALTSEKTATAGDATPASADVKQAQALAGRFSAALDTKVSAAFTLAEQVYQTRARIWAGGVAIALSLGYHYSTTSGALNLAPAQIGGWAFALIIGLVAVPLAPAAKDLSTSISDAVTALSKVPGGRV